MMHLATKSPRPSSPRRFRAAAFSALALTGAFLIAHSAHADQWALLIGIDHVVLTNLHKLAHCGTDYHIANRPGRRSAWPLPPCGPYGH